MGTRTRRWILFAHVVTSVGWIGVEASILALGAIGLTSDNPTVVTSAHVVAGQLGELFYLPASLLALVTGVLLGLGTKWGLVRYHWVTLKLVLNLALLLGGNLLVIPTFVTASQRAASGAPIGTTAVMLCTAMTARLTLLLVAAQVSITKPWGKTRWHPQA